MKLSHFIDLLRHDIIVVPVILPSYIRAFTREIQAMRASVGDSRAEDDNNCGLRHTRVTKAIAPPLTIKWYNVRKYRFNSYSSFIILLFIMPSILRKYTGKGTPDDENEIFWAFRPVTQMPQLPRVPAMLYDISIVALKKPTRYYLNFCCDMKKRMKFQPRNHCAHISHDA